MTGRRIICVMALTMLMASIASCGKSGNSDFVEPPHSSGQESPVPYDKEDGVIRLVSYNVGLFAKYTKSLNMVADMMNELQADAVCLNELDSCAIRTDRVYQSKALAEKMGGWHHYFAGAMSYSDGRYGEGMVVSPKFSNQGTYTVHIPKGAGAEPRVCAVFKTDKFIFLATHLDHVNAGARLDGAVRISEWAKQNYGDSDIPVFLCGDMNCEPSDEPILRLNEDWIRLSVIKSTYPAGPGKYAKKCIDFVFALKNNAKYEIVGSDVPLAFKSGRVSEASDHLPIYVDVRLK